MLNSGPEFPARRGGSRSIIIIVVLIDSDARAHRIGRAERDDVERIEQVRSEENVDIGFQIGEGVADNERCRVDHQVAKMLVRIAVEDQFDELQNDGAGGATLPRPIPIAAVKGKELVGAVGMECGIRLRNGSTLVEGDDLLERRRSLGGHGENIGSLGAA